MKIEFTKMQGAGNDFVVLDETQGQLGLKAAHYRYLGNRHFGIGADQILTVRPSPAEGVDFEYIIHNADGQEVEQCGNGARCFARFVQDRGLSDKAVLRVQTKKGIISPRIQSDGQVTVDMGSPVFTLEQVPFYAAGLVAQAQGAWELWPLEIEDKVSGLGTVWVAPVSMGNPHAVQIVSDVDALALEIIGPLIQQHARFPEHVNAGYMQIMSRNHIKLRVYERGVGETLACGTGACAAVVAGIRLGLLDAQVRVQTRGGELTLAWAGVDQGVAAPVFMTGPAETVFCGVIDVPDMEA